MITPFLIFSSTFFIVVALHTVINIIHSTLNSFCAVVFKWLHHSVWLSGIYICELMLGRPPFQASDPMKTYTLILKGVDALEIPNRCVFQHSAFFDSCHYHCSRLRIRFWGHCWCAAYVKSKLSQAFMSMRFTGFWSLHIQSLPAHRLFAELSQENIYKETICAS